MAFNINAQVILSGPKNLRAITKKIEAGLSSVSTPVRLKMDKGLTRQVSAFNQNLTNLNKNFNTLQSSSKTANTAVKSTGQSLKQVADTGKKVASSQKKTADSFKKSSKEIAGARNELQLFGKDAALALRRFAGFTIATTVVFGFTRAVGGATKAALEFQRELVKVVQISGASAQKMAGLRKTIDDLSVSLGLDANELLSLAKTFAQTGQTIDQVRASIRAIARSSLTPTFGTMKDTTEGLIAAMAQFGIKAEKAESVLASMNAVSKKFAVEAEDLVSVIRRAGGVFSTAAGQMRDPQQALNELIGIFTAVRSTTRESADTIAVGLRTIFTRIQRGSTIKFLKQFNIELIDAKGNFIGLFPAFQELSKGLDSIVRSGDALTLSAITEELGGVRQVGKLIPAIKEFNKALEATEIAGQAAKKGLGKDVALALQPVAKQFELVQKRFDAFIRDVAASKTFQGLAKTAISIANAFLSVAESLKPLIPLIATIATVKLTKGAFSFGAGFFGGLRKGGGAEGAGGGVARAITGGGGGGRGRTRKEGGASGAVQANTEILRTANTSIGALTEKVSESIAAISNANTQSESRSTILIGAVGRLITALDRSRGGFGGFPAPRKFARGGVVSGPSHARGGVMAELEGGETVIPKGYAGGGAIVQIKPGSVGGFFLRPASGIDPAWNINREIPTTGGTSALEAAVMERVGKSAAETSGTAITRSAPQWEKLKGHEASWDIGSGDERVTQRSLNRFARLSAAQQATAADTIKGFQGPPTNRKPIKVSGVKSTHPLGLLQAEVLRGPAGGMREGPHAGLDSVTIQGRLQGFTTGQEDLGRSGPIHERVADKAVAGIRNAVNSVSRAVHKSFQQPAGAQFLQGKEGISDDQLANIDMNAVEGYILEGLVENLTGAGLAGTEKDAAGNEVEAGFDFPSVGGAKDALAELFGNSLVKKLRIADAKRQSTKSNRASINDKLATHFQNKTDRAFGSDNIVQTVFRKSQKRAAGGNIFGRQGTDTVPAMLTPGEFVINKQSAQKIGYSKLGKMNRYARGGVVGYEEGAKVAATGSVGISFKGMETADDKAKELARGLRQLGVTTVDAVRIVGQFRTALEAGATNAEALAQARLPVRGGVKAQRGNLPKAQSVTPASDAQKRIENLSKVFNGLTQEAEELGVALDKGEITMDDYAKKIDIVQRKQKKTDEIIGKDAGGGGMLPGTVGSKKGKRTVGDVRRQLSPEAIRKVVTGKGKKTNEQFVEGVGSAVTAVAGFTAAISSFDLKHPMASLLSLGYAAQQASTAIKMLGGADVIGKWTKQFKGTDFGKKIMGQLEGVKGAPKKLFSSFKDAGKSFTAARGTRGPTKGLGKFTGLISDAGKGLKGFKGSLLKNFNATSLKGLLAKGFTGIPGIITALVGTMIIGPIAKKISSAAFGKKEKIEGTNIEGFESAGAAAGAMGGALESAGKATGAGLAALAVGGPVIGGVVAGLMLAKGALQGWAKQLEFNAFKELTKSVKKANKAFEQFEKLPDVSAKALHNLNETTAKVSQRFDKSFEASRTRERIDQGFTVSGFLGSGGTVQSLAGRDTMMEGNIGRGSMSGEASDVLSATAGVGGSMAAGAAVGATIGAIVGSIVPIIGTGLVAAVGAGIGALVGLGVALFSTDKQVEASAKAFDKAAKAITPEFLENLDKAWEKTLNAMINRLEVLDPDLIGEMATQQTSNITMDQSALSTQERAIKATQDWDSVLSRTDDALGGATGATSGFVAELRRLQAQKLDFRLIDAVVKEASVMGEEAAMNLKAGFQKVRMNVQMGEDESMTDFNKRQRDFINGMKGMTSANQRALKGMIDAEALRDAETNKRLATETAVAMAMKEAHRELDALAEGMRNFASQTGGISDQLKIFVDRMQSDFDALFSDKQVIGQVQEFNPFTNVEASTRQQIGAGMEQVSGLGQFTPDTDPFKDITGLISAQKEIPFAMKDALDELNLEAPTGQVGNEEVFSRIIEKLGDRGITLPDNALAGVRELITAEGRQTEGVFKLEGLQRMLEREGEVTKNLLEMSETARAAMETAFGASQEYRNAILKIASMQQQMIEKERDMSLSSLKRTHDVRDRVNKALGKTPNVWNKAVGDMHDKLQTLTAPVAGAGVGGVANVFDVRQLVSQRDALTAEKEKQKGVLGLGAGQVFDANSIDVLGKAQTDAATKLAAVNAQLNGNTQALKELAGDTRLLAAIEQEIAGLQKKALAAEQGAMSLAEAMIKVQTGEMSAQDFNRQFADPINAFEKFRDNIMAGGQGPQVSANQAVALRKALQSGGGLLGGEFNMLIEQIAKNQGKTEGEVRQEMLDKLGEGIVREAGKNFGDPGATAFLKRGMDEKARLDTEVEGKAQDMQALATLQQAAEKALFDDQRKGFAKMLANANVELTHTISRFQEAVDDFRGLRGMGVSAKEGAQKVNVRKQQLQQAQQALGADPKNKAKQRDVEAARVNLSTAEANLARSIKRRDDQVKKAIAAKEAAQEQLKGLGPEGETVSQFTRRQQAKISSGAVTFGEGTQMSKKAQKFSDKEFSWGWGGKDEEEYLNELMAMSGMKGEELKEFKKLNKDSLGIGVLGNQEFHEGAMKGQAENQQKLFKMFSERMFGEGTVAAKEFASKMAGAADAAEGNEHDVNDFMVGLKGAFKGQVASVKKRQAKIKQNAAADHKINKNRQASVRKTAEAEAKRERELKQKQVQDIADVKEVKRTGDVGTRKKSSDAQLVEIKETPQQKRNKEEAEQALTEISKGKTGATGNMNEVMDKLNKGQARSVEATDRVANVIRDNARNQDRGIEAQRKAAQAQAEADARFERQLNEIPPPGGWDAHAKRIAKANQQAGVGMGPAAGGVAAGRGGRGGAGIGGVANRPKTLPTKFAGAMLAQKVGAPDPHAEMTAHNERIKEQEAKIAKMAEEGYDDAEMAKEEEKLQQLKDAQLNAARLEQKPGTAEGLSSAAEKAAEEEARYEAARAQWKKDEQNRKEADKLAKDTKEMGHDLRPFSSTGIFREKGGQKFGADDPKRLEGNWLGMDRPFDRDDPSSKIGSASALKWHGIGQEDRTLVDKRAQRSFMSGRTMLDKLKPQRTGRGGLDVISRKTGELSEEEAREKLERMKKNYTTMMEKFEKSKRGWEGKEGTAAYQKSSTTGVLGGRLRSLEALDKNITMLEAYLTDVEGGGDPKMAPRRPDKQPLPDKATKEDLWDPNMQVPSPIQLDEEGNTIRGQKFDKKGNLIGPTKLGKMPVGKGPKKQLASLPKKFHGGDILAQQVRGGINEDAAAKFGPPAKPLNIGNIAGMDVGEDPMGVFKKMLQVYGEGPSNVVIPQQFGGLGGMNPRGGDVWARGGMGGGMFNVEEGRPRKKLPGQIGGGTGGGDVSGSIFDALSRGGQSVGQILTDTFTTAANQMRDVLTSDDVAQSLGNAIKSAFDATTIDLNANLGPISVNLTGGELLKALSKELLEKLRGDIAGVVSSIFNNDGSQKTITNARVPRTPE